MNTISYDPQHLSYANQVATCTGTQHYVECHFTDPSIRLRTYVDGAQKWLMDGDHPTRIKPLGYYYVSRAMYASDTTRIYFDAIQSPHTHEQVVLTRYEGPFSLSPGDKVPESIPWAQDVESLLVASIQSCLDMNIERFRRQFVHAIVTYCEDFYDQPAEAFPDLVEDVYEQLSESLFLP